MTPRPSPKPAPRKRRPRLRRRLRIGLGVSLGLLLLHAVLLLSGFEVLACSGRTGASLNSRGLTLYGARGVYRFFLYDVAIAPAGGYAWSHGRQRQVVGGVRESADASMNGVPRAGRLLTHLSITSVDQAKAEPSLFASGLALNVIASQPINDGYFRSRSDLWRLRYPLWKLALLAMSPWLVSAVALQARLWGKQLAHRRRQRRPTDRCRSCGYSLKGLAGSDRCPECGTTVWTAPTADQPNEASSR